MTEQQTAPDPEPENGELHDEGAGPDPEADDEPEVAF